jgi:N-acetylmuramic acid 6-phosphate (MurNAc-6-P) etherase
MNDKVLRRDQMLEAAESPGGFSRLRDLVQNLLDSGLSEESLLEDLGEIRALVPEDVEDLIMEVMDLLVGWCAPSARLRRRTDEAT